MSNKLPSELIIRFDDGDMEKYPITEFEITAKSNACTLLNIQARMDHPDSIPGQMMEKYFQDLSDERKKELIRKYL
jgi:hypothetical protein